MAPLTPSSPTEQQPRFRILRNSLVVPPEITLPPFCVQTGDQVDEHEMRRSVLYWFPKTDWSTINAASYLVGIPLFWLVPFWYLGNRIFFWQTCTVTFGLGVKARRTLRLKRLPVLLIPAAFAAGLIFWAIIEGAMICFLPVILPVLLVSVMVLKPQPIYVEDFDQGFFKLSGFGGRFLTLTRPYMLGPGFMGGTAVDPEFTGSAAAGQAAQDPEMLAAWQPNVHAHLLQFLIYTAAADGIIDEAEVATFSEIYRQFTGQEISIEAFKLQSSALGTSKQAWLENLELLSSKLSADVKTKFLKAGVSVANADGQYDISERTFLFDVGRALRMSNLELLMLIPFVDHGGETLD